MKRTLSMLIAVLLIVGLMPLTVLAAEAPTFSGGKGTKEDPYRISTVEDLIALENAINDGDAAAMDVDECGIGNYCGYYFLQTQDIDLEGVEWEPIGYSSTGYYFAGHYDGGNHKILNMSTEGMMTAEDHPAIDAAGQVSAGFFGWVAFGSVSNLHIVGAKSILADTTETVRNGQPYAGGLAAVAYSAKIYNCSVSDSFVSAIRASNSAWGGGLVGWSYSTSSFEKCAVSNTVVTGSGYAGGFVGEITEYEAIITVAATDCYVANTVVQSTQGSDDACLGGFIGQIGYDYEASALALTNCFVYNTAVDATMADPRALTGSIVARQIYGELQTENSYYYLTGEAEGETDTMEARTADEFADGTVTGLLGDAFIDGKEHPILISMPADYTAVDEAVTAAASLKAEDYENFDAVEAAIAAVVRGKTVAEQATVDGYAKAITDAIAALKLKPAADNPSTGDPLAVWLVLLTVSAGGLLLFRKKRYE